MLHNKRSNHNEKPMHHNWRVTPALHNERKPECRNKDRAQPQNNQITFLRNRILKYLKVDKKKNVIS